MNSEIQRFYDLNRMYTPLRDQLMDILTDEDLKFQVEHNPTLGALCRELGETQQIYIDSLKSFSAKFTYGTSDSQLANSVSKLKAWYQQLDDDLKAVLETITDDDVKNRKVEREGFSIPPQIHLDVLREALLIFYGKVSIYLRAMGKSAPEQWQGWIG